MPTSTEAEALVGMALHLGHPERYGAARAHAFERAIDGPDRPPRVITA
jgi:hypothetical protein